MSYPTEAGPAGRPPRVAAGNPSSGDTPAPFAGPFPDYENYDGVALAALVAAGETTAAELLEAALARVERYNPLVNAVTATFSDAAAQREGTGTGTGTGKSKGKSKSKSKSKSKGKDEFLRHAPAGALAGVPFLLKDLGLTLAGQRLGQGSRLFRDFVPDLDATLVERYRAAGLTLFGKTNTPEFGLAMATEPRATGATLNPWDRRRSAGGSSGGAAAAVAAGMVPLAHASDGGGSIRMPAANCGVFGLKPSRARTPMGPQVGEGWGGLAVQHCVSRSVRDSALLLDLTHGPAIGDPYHAPPAPASFSAALAQTDRVLRVGLLLDAGAEPQPDPPIALHPDCIAAAEDAAALCESLGHRVEPAVFRYDFVAMREAMGVIIAGNLHFNLNRHWSAHGLPPGPDGLEPITWLWAEQGTRLTAADYAGAIHTVHTLGRRHAAFLENHDVVLSPVLAQPPLPLGATDMGGGDLDAYRATLSLMPFTPIYNISGCPAMSVPLYWNAAGLPVGVQFGARNGDEFTLLQLAAQLERARPWFRRRPPLS